MIPVLFKNVSRRLTVDPTASATMYKMARPACRFLDDPQVMPVEWKQGQE